MIKFNCVFTINGELIHSKDVSNHYDKRLLNIPNVEHVDVFASLQYSSDKWDIIISSKIPGYVPDWFYVNRERYLKQIEDFILIWVDEYKKKYPESM